MTHDNDRHAAAKLWLQGWSDNRIHKETGVARTTLKAWRERDQEFAVTVDTVRSEILREQAGQALPVIKAAWDVVARAMGGEEIEPSRLKLAQQLLEKTHALHAAGRQLGLEQVNQGKSTGVTVNVVQQQGATQDEKPARDVTVTSYGDDEGPEK